MSDQQYIKSKLKVSEIVILTIGVISTISLGTYLITNGVYIYGGSILFFGLYFIYIFLNYDILYVNKNEILIKSVTGKLKKKIELKIFKYFTEIEKENSGRNLAHRKWKDLTLVSEDYSYKISSLT